MILIDFDGTIIDLWPRFYTVFTDILGIQNISMQQYKEAKRKLRNDSEVAHFFGRELTDDYFSQKARMLEDERYLNLDRMFFDRDEINWILQSGVKILTKRRNPAAFYQELMQLGICGSSAVVVETNKYDWIRLYHDPCESVLIIGDSVSELEAAKLENVEAWMVGYGISSKKTFDSMQIPYRYFDQPYQMMNTLKERIRG